MFNLFVLIKPNIQKYTLLIEKVTFQEKQYKIRFFSTKFEFQVTFKNKTICIRRKIVIFFSFKKKKKTRCPKAGHGPRQGTFPDFLRYFKFFSDLKKLWLFEINHILDTKGHKNWKLIVFFNKYFCIKNYASDLRNHLQILIEVDLDQLKSVKIQEARPQLGHWLGLGQKGHDQDPMT